MALLENTNKGWYCPQADVYVDPFKKVKRALITHGHADHSRWGHSYYLCTRSARPVIRKRLGPINIEVLEYGEEKVINGVKISFHPAGHIIGSAQIRFEYKGEIWVVSGDYKLENDGLAEAFEPVRCHTFITESTFARPQFVWPDQASLFAAMNEWWRNNQAAGKVSVIGAYALGKAQRIIQHIDHSIGPIFTHAAVENLNEVIRRQGIALKETIRIQSKLKKKNFNGGLIILPPSVLNPKWGFKYRPFSTALTSGWMQKEVDWEKREVDIGFTLSDHADWPGLNKAIKESEASKIIVTHGPFTEEFRDYLKSQRYEAFTAKELR